MKIIPAIDLFNKEAVRLLKGDYAQKTVYSNEPWELVKAFDKYGAQLIHVVDLNGARSGADTTNRDCIVQIRQSTSAQLQLGGGIRTIEKLKYYRDIGIDRFILGTAAVRDPDFVDEALKLIGVEKIVIGVDARDGYVRVSGWEENTKLHYQEFLQQLQKQGVRHIVYTDIALDGTLQGPNLESYRDILNQFSFELIASGGISSVKDIIALSQLNTKYPLFGVITGKAIYEGRLNLEEILADLREKNNSKEV